MKRFATVEGSRCIQLNWSDEPGRWKDFNGLDPDKSEDEQIVEHRDEFARDRVTSNVNAHADFRIGIATKSLSA